MKFGTVVALACLLALVSACGGKKKDQPPPPQAVPSQVVQPVDDPALVKWTFQPGAIQIRLYVQDPLNEYEGLPHALSLCIYQLKDPSAFNELSGNQGGLVKLLDCNKFDPSVVHFQRVFVQPGTDSTLVLDRAEGGQIVAVAAGYFALKPGLVTRVVQIPLDVTETGVLFKSNQYAPGKLRMNLLLGPRSIQKVGE